MMYGMVMTPISMLEAVSMVFITALNFTECVNCFVMFERSRSAQRLGVAAFELGERRTVQRRRDT